MEAATRERLTDLKSLLIRHRLVHGGALLVQPGVAETRIALKSDGSRRTTSCSRRSIGLFGENVSAVR